MCKLHLLGGESRSADAEERVEEVSGPGDTVNSETLLHEIDGKSRGVRAVLVARHDGVVGHKPGVSTAAFVISAGVGPALDVAFVGIGNPGLAALKGNVAGFGEVKNVFVAVVDEALRIDGLEVAGGDFFAFARVDGDRFYPVKGVLENERGRFFGESEEELMGKKGILWRGPEIEKEGAAGLEQAMDFGSPFMAPADEL